MNYPAPPSSDELNGKSDDAGKDQGSNEGNTPAASKKSEGDEIYTMLAVLKWSLLGVYFFLEMWTIVSYVLSSPFLTSRQHATLSYTAWFA